MGQSQRERERTRAEVWERKGRLHSEETQISKRGRVNKESLPRSRRKHERVSGSKSSPGESAVLVSLHVWSNLKWERKSRDEEFAHKLTE